MIRTVNDRLGIKHRCAVSKLGNRWIVTSELRAPDGAWVPGIRVQTAFLRSWRSKERAERIAHKWLSKRQAPLAPKPTNISYVEERETV